MALKQVVLSFFVIGMSLFIFACQPAKLSVTEELHAAVGVLDAAISKDGHFAVVSSMNFGVSYWDLEKNELKFIWKHDDNPNDAIIAVNLSPDGGRAITANKRTFIIWNTNSGKAYGYWKAPADIRAVALSEKGRYVLLGLGDGRAIHIDMSTGRRLEFTGHRAEAVASVDLSANGLWAFTGGNDYRAILWNTKTGKPHQLLEHDTRVVKVKLADDAKRAFTAGTLANASVWDITTGKKISQLDLKKREYVITAVNFSNNSQQLVTGAPSKDISIWDINTGNRLQQWRARTKDQNKPSGAIVYAVAFTQDDQFVVSESSAGYGEKWPIDIKQTIN